MHHRLAVGSQRVAGGDRAVATIEYEITSLPACERLPMAAAWH
jgi:hypothetical protein